MVRTRILKLARLSLVEHSRRCRDLQILEPIAYDGVENFAQSQYEPNNVNQAIGANSHFIYDFDFAPLNRKGKMSERQKRIKAQIEANRGAFPKDAVRRSTTEILKRLLRRCPQNTPLRLQTDQHFHYRRSIQHDILGHAGQHSSTILHSTISSKATRLYRHILFTVNHTDLLLRQHVKAFARETISFSKSHPAMLLKYALFMAWKNYLRPQFVKPHRRDPRSNTRTPAMAVGLTDHPLRFGEFFGRRVLASQIDLSPTWKDIYVRRETYPRTKV